MSSFDIDNISLFVCFLALRPKSTAMVMMGRSVHLTTLFSWAGLNKRLTSREENDRRNYFMINLEVWYQAGIELATPGSAVRHASIARHVTDCATGPGDKIS